MQSINPLTKLVQVKMREDTIKEIDEVQKKIQAPSMSDAVRRSIGIAYALTKYVEDGDKIIIETKDGEKKQLIITGMEKHNAGQNNR